MILEHLNKLNPEIEIFSIDSPVFAEYGKKISKIDTSEIVNMALKIKLPESGSIYEPSIPDFEKLKIAREITENCFGELPTQIGYCYGHNNLLNALEWHTSSEINIAVTDLVLILGKRENLKDNCMNSSYTKAFLLRKGDIAEIYATTLHFCPCEVDKSGFGCVVGLPAGTNTSLNNTPSDRLLFRKNKWIIAHKDNYDLLNKGVFGGISGKNYKINL